MKPRVSLSGLEVVCGVCLTRLAISLFLLILTTSAFCQRSYFEYNNPEAIKLNKKVIDQLTGVEWTIKDVRWQIRKDTFDFHGGGLTLHRNGAYSSSHPMSSGTWELKYRRYLILTDTSERVNNRALSGTFAIKSVTDSALVLTQLHTSSGDMSRTIKLVKYPGYGDYRKYPAYDKQGKAYSWKPEWKRRNELAPALIDSLTFLQRDVLELLGHRESNDTLFINTADSLYKIRLDRNNPLKRVKIFYEDENLEGYEAFRRFTLSTDRIPLVDSLAMKHIRQHRDDYYPQKEISLSSYFRQYLGYFDVNGDAIVLLNAFCQYKNGWRDSLVQGGLGGVCYFNISINITKKEAFSFHVNDF